MADVIEVIVSPVLTTEIYNQVIEAGNKINNSFKQVSTKINEDLKGSTNGLKNNLPKLNNNFKKTFSKIGIDFKSQIQRMKSEMDQKLKAPKGLSSSFKKIGLAIGAALTVGAVKNFTSESIELYKAQNLVETKLKANMRTVKAYGGDVGLMNQAFNRFKKITSEIQSKGVIGDEVLLSGAAQLSTFQMSEKTISSLLPKMADMLVNQKGMNATQEDAYTLANQLGKALSTGELSVLTKSGITIDENTKKMFSQSNGIKRAGMLQKILADNVGKANEEMSKTPEGQIKQVSNAWGDIKEDIGRAIIPLVLKFSKILKENLPQIQAGFLKIAEIVPPAFDKIVSVFSKVKNTLKSIHDNIGIDNIAIFISTFMAISKIPLIIAGVVGTFIKLKKGIMAVNAVMVANPIGIACALIATAVYLIYKNWDKIGPVVKKLITSITTGFKNAFATVTNFFKKIPEFAKSIFNSKFVQILTWPIRTWFNIVKTIFVGIYNFVKSIFKNMVGVVSSMVESSKNIFIYLKTGIVNVFNGIVEIVKEPLIILFEFIKNIFNSFVDIMKAPFLIAVDFIKGAILSVIGFIEGMINKIINGMNKVSSLIPGMKEIETVDFKSSAENFLKIDGPKELPKLSKEDIKKSELNQNLNITLPPEISSEFKNEITNSLKIASSNERRRRELESGLV